MSEAQLFPWLLLGWTAAALCPALLLLFVSAPYGRHARKGWGPMLSPRLGWLLMEAPSPLVFLYCFVLGPGRGAAQVALLLLWQLHYIHRAFIFPFRIRSKPMPLVVALMGLGFNFMNAYLNGRWLFHLSTPLPVSWLCEPRFLAGAALFLAGFAINQHADAVLLSLRRPGEQGYRIPHGGLYRLVSCPNYLGEIIEWSGWAVASWSLPGLAFAVWTVANLAPRALAHHRFYRERFADYPKERRALLPYLL